ncbi:hypothetical protein FE391_24450 [Nonomuraea sp. KC401]|uniref:hypothetical protein n=1 Tax=unclassified Nonomuraea TaxID=2593643 RepID=UPI0010FE09E9|nr:MULTISPECIES: hypothetical protein [unclassified Nonomuraea]NBE95443.1 hypothetical protein [Nonomuraea sp. K271]TLF66354.1 hypothetical protein FE391_24450 [Nonomuraea sp. KC401]
MRVHGRRTTLALAAGLLAAVTACSGDAQPRATPTSSAAAATSSPSPSPDEPEVTRTEAAEVFAEVTLSEDVLRVKSDLQGRLGLAVDLTDGGQTRITVADYLSTDYAPRRYTWGSPTLFVPRFEQGEGSPWFSALATRDGRPTLLTFTRSDRWRISSAAQLLPGQKLPEIEFDADGYAGAVGSDDKTVTISPQFMGPVHASVAETGTAGVTAGLIAAGPYTTEIAEQIASRREDAKAEGFSYDSIFSADNYPVYALRTEDGGALIQYSLSRTTTTTTRTAEDDYIPVPKSARWAISTPVLRRTLRLVETHQYATAVPPLTAPKAAAVIAHDGALTRATGT